MIAIPAGILVIVVHEPVNFSCGIDGMRGHCVSITKKTHSVRVFSVCEQKKKSSPSDLVRWAGFFPVFKAAFLWNF